MRHLLTAWVALVAAFGGGAATINWYLPNLDYSIARNWSERALEGIRMDTPHPPGQAPDLFSVSVCMYDAWAAYDSSAVGFAYFLEDGSPQTAGTPFPTANLPLAYPDYPVGHPRRYGFANPPMNPTLHGIDDATNHTVVDIIKWQRLIVVVSIDQNGFPENLLQGYLGAQG